MELTVKEFEHFYRCLYRPLGMYVLRYTENIDDAEDIVQEAYEQVKTNTGGKNADYIPYLANVNKDLFGISVCLLNGQTIHVGD